MAETRKVLGQLSCAALTEETVYAVPAATQVVISSVVFCNRSVTATTFRLYIGVADAATDNKQYIYYDVALPGNDSFVCTIGITMGALDDMRVYVGAATVSVTVYGVEIT